MPSEKKLAVYPGTFDPVTSGHISLIERASHLFDEIIVAVVRGGGKDIMFDADQRVGFIQKAVPELIETGRVRVTAFTGLTADFAREAGAHAIIRGMRAVSDFEYEFQMALMNRKLARQVETVFLMPSLSWVYLSSSLVKDVALNGGDVTGLVPPEVKKALTERSRQNSAK
jgi:pantetheine-phosphate adenylyltransferase